MNDYIQLPRSALNDDLWRNKEYGCLLWFLLCKADNQGVATFTAADIEMRLGISRQRLRTMLGKIRKSGLATNIQPTSNQQATNITFDFQYVANAEQPTSNQRPTNKQPTKRVGRPDKFTPPTREEAQAYIDKMGFHWGDADLFIDFNKQKGWRLSDGKPMQDWRAAMRNWENRWKQKYKNGELKTNSTDKYAARRGTDVGNHTEADYGGPF